MAATMASVTAVMEEMRASGSRGATINTTNNHVSVGNHNITTNSHNTTTMYNNYILINDFGKENTSYLHSPEVLMKLRNHGVMKAIHQIHFNDDHVENQNVRLKSLKKSLVEVVQDGHWTPRCMSSVTDEMIKNAFGVITRRYVLDESFREEMYAANGDGLLEWYMRMASMGHEKQAVMTPLRRDLEALLVAKKPVPDAKEKAVVHITPPSATRLVTTGEEATS